MRISCWFYPLPSFDSQTISYLNIYFVKFHIILQLQKYHDIIGKSTHILRFNQDTKRLDRHLQNRDKSFVVNASLGLTRFEISQLWNRLLLTKIRTLPSFSEKKKKKSEKKNIFCLIGPGTENNQQESAMKEGGNACSTVSLICLNYRKPALTKILRPLELIKAGFESWWERRRRCQSRPCCCTVVRSRRRRKENKRKQQETRRVRR